LPARTGIKIALKLRQVEVEVLHQELFDSYFTDTPSGV